MDTLTHAALGACIGAAVLGRTISVRKAAIMGGVLANLPDLDVFWPHDNPVDSFVLHRAATHSLFMQALAAPILGEALRRLDPLLKQARAACYAAVFLSLASHALLDAFTVYGTRLFWPLWPQPVAIGSIFVIDPLYTVPLLVAMVWALSIRQWSRRFRAALVAGLALSSVYMGWSMVAQSIAQARAVQLLAEAGIEAQRMVATPTPLNTLFWRVIALDGPRYYNIYVPMVGGRQAITAYAHRRGNELGGCLAGNGPTLALAEFNGEFHRFDLRAGHLVWSDLRMGLTPDYNFRFALAETGQPGLNAIAPFRLRSARDYQSDLPWLWAGVSGAPIVRRAEAANAFTSLAQAELAAPGRAGRPC